MHRGRRAGATPLREIGVHPADGKPVQLFDGKYGPYVKHGDLNASLPRGTDPAHLPPRRRGHAARGEGEGPQGQARWRAQTRARREVVTVTVVGGGLAGSEAAWALADRGVRRHACGDAPGGAHAGPPDRPPRRARLQQHLQVASSSTTLTACSRRSCATLGRSCCSMRRRAPRAGRHRARRRSRGVRRGWCRRRSVSHPRITRRARRSDRRCRRGRSWPPARSPPTRCPGDRRARLAPAALAFYDAIAPIVERTSRSIMTCSSRRRGTARARATTTSTRRCTARAVRGR